MKNYLSILGSVILLLGGCITSLCSPIIIFRGVTILFGISFNGYFGAIALFLGVCFTISWIVYFCTRGYLNE